MTIYATSHHLEFEEGRLNTVVLTVKVSLTSSLGENESEQESLFFTKTFH